jgi:hypothetical protein
MIYARLSFNDKNWLSPSGSFGKSKNNYTHEGQYGFGFEEWLFSKDQLVLSKNKDEYYYGYIEGIHKNYKKEDEEEALILFTINSVLKQRFIVAEITEWKYVCPKESLFIVNQNLGLVKEMKRQVITATGNTLISMNQFDKHANNNQNGNKCVQLFNIKFKKFEYVFDINNRVNKTHVINKFNRFWLYRR